MRETQHDARDDLMNSDVSDIEAFTFGIMHREDERE
jgi:hypothetical protein